jgi:hypothetical protein
LEDGEGCEGQFQCAYRSYAMLRMVKATWTGIVRSGCKMCGEVDASMGRT